MLVLALAFFGPLEKNSSPKKLKAEKNSREFSEKLKPFLGKLKILPTQLVIIAIQKIILLK